MKLASLVLGLALFQCRALPQSRLITQNGKPIVLTLKDGREATLYYQRRSFHKINVPFEVFTSSCTRHMHQKCTYSMGRLAARFVFKWTKHSDPDKLGAEVLRDYPSAGLTLPFQYMSVLGDFSQSTHGSLLKGLPRDELSCNEANYLWLPASQREQTEVVRWEVEGMRTNPETRASENRTYGWASNIVLKRSHRKYILSSVRNYNGSFQEQLFFGDYWSWVLPNSDGNYCHLTLKPDLSNVIGDTEKEFARSSEDAPYVWMSDEYSTAGPLEHLPELLKNFDQYVFL